jgi:hypothetical protein
MAGSRWGSTPPRAATLPPIVSETHRVSSSGTCPKGGFRGRSQAGNGCRVPHPLDLIALILGILFTLRHMNVSQRQPEELPNVRADDFLRWKAAAAGAYRLGSSACFGKVLLDLVFAYVMRTYALTTAIRWSIGLTLDLGWIALVVLCAWRVRRAHALARELGIEAKRR